jgi:hypothetical protein
MLLTVSAWRLQPGEREILRTWAADPRSDWTHAYSAGRLLLTDRRLCFEPVTLSAGTGPQACALPIDAIEKVSLVPVPVWVLGVVCVWLRGIRVVTTSGSVRTLVVGSAHASAWAGALDQILVQQRRTLRRAAAATG